MHTRASLLADLRTLGVEVGSTLFVHSSLRSVGAIAGGAAAVIAALEDALGQEGLLLLPSFNLVPRDKEGRAAGWDCEQTPSTVGWLSEYFRRMPGTARSDHYSHAVAARGRKASTFVADHCSDEGPPSPWDLPPWGKAFGTDLPMFRAWAQGGHLLMLGVDYTSSTYIHFVEVLYWQKLRASAADARFPALKRAELGAFWDRGGHLQRGPVGDARCRLFSLDEYVQTLLAEVEVNPTSYLS
jgi:aminoglycoside 3-N-acetyltransferase